MKTAMLSRRHLMTAAVTLPILPAFSRSAHASAEMLGTSSATFDRFKLGDFEVTTLLAGTRIFDKPQETYGMNVDAAEFAAISEAAFIPADKAQSYFTPTVVNTGNELVLFDTGLAPEAMTGALDAAGYSPDQVDIVVITHMHGDHIGGLMGDGAETFGNARYVTGSAEHNHWMGAGNENFDAKVRPLNEKMTFLEDGGTVVSGLTAVLCPGHTPGHMGFMVESGGRQIMITGDLANHPIWSVENPDWEVRFDMDKATAAQSRRKVLDMLAADRVPFIGYHMPFPAIGYVETRDNGYRYIPASYQMAM
ncbi:MAG: MBL fold metallo-hydrolase [Pseudorhodobacter sp.]